jgi:hypothetical protein
LKFLGFLNVNPQEPPTEIVACGLWELRYECILSVVLAGVPRMTYFNHGMPLSFSARKAG